MIHSIVTKVLSNLRSQLRTRNAQYTPAYETFPRLALILLPHQETYLGSYLSERFITQSLFLECLVGTCRFFDFLQNLVATVEAILEGQEALNRC
jgi:hypothetical protein